MTHSLSFLPGDHPRNHVVRCSCGWAYSSTYKDIRLRGKEHVSEDNQFDWHDERREFQKDR